MGLTKQYLRFVPGSVYNIISSATGNILFVNFRGENQNFVAVPACENVLIWNYRTGERVHILPGDKHCVTCLVSDNVRNTLAVGYADGAVRVFNLNTGLLLVSFSGHKSAVSALAYDERSLRLASCGKDTEIVLWDLVGECGLFRLKGHKGPVTNCHFLMRHNVLITSSEDTLLKFWNLDSQHCFKTLVGSRGEIWDFVVLNDERLVTGINDSDLRVWDMKFSDVTDVQDNVYRNLDSQDDDSHDVDNLTLVEVGKILTSGEKKTISVGVDKEARILACHGYAKSLHMFKLLNGEEILKKLRRRRKKEKKMENSQSASDEANSGDFAVTLSDEIERMKSIQTDAKIVNFQIEVEKSGMVRIAVLLNDNSFSIYGIPTVTKDSEAVLLHSIRSGHCSTVNTLSFSTDSTRILSASNDSIKIWNRESQVCTHTFKCDVALCSLFVTGNNYCIVGVKAGQLQIYELASHQLVEAIKAHEGQVSCMASSPDQRTIASGSSDKDVKFWEYELIKDETFSNTKKRLTLLHVRTLKMSEEIQCLKYSPNDKYLAVSLLDCTVKVFFCDTLKFAFSLYGHKLPIPCMDISHDGSLLATGSKDKNIKIWSLEFGNCLKSIFAHDESIVCLQFLPKTHMIFTASKDKKLKQWDCDNFQKIITLDGHQGKVSAMAVSPDGTTVVTASQDRSLRLWGKTNEPLVLEEERENEREEHLEQQMIASEPVIAGETSDEVGLAARATVQTLKTTEQLIEAIDIFKSEIASLQEYKQECKSAGKTLPLPTPHPMLVAYSTTCPYQYMLKILQKSRSSDFERTLLYLPFSYAMDFLKILAEFSKRKWELELSSRCILFLVRIHLCQIILCPDMYSLLEQLKTTLLEGLSEIKDTVGFNLSGLKFVQKQIEACEEVCLFKDASQKLKRKNRKRDLITFV